MKKNFLVPVWMLLLVVLLTWGLAATKASLNDASTARVLLTAATLDFDLNGDSNSALSVNLGDVKPGDLGVVNVTVNNEGSIPGNLCIESSGNIPGFEITPVDLCGVTIEPGGSLRFDLSWSLPPEAHNMGLDETSFEFFYSFLFENGFKVTKQVILAGRIVDPTDTPTPTLTETATATQTATDTPTEIPTVTETPTMVETSTNTPEPTATATATDTSTPTPVDTPTETSTPTEYPTAPPVLETPNYTPTTKPTTTDIPTSTPVPSETVIETPTEEPTVTETPTVEMSTNTPEA